MDDDDVRLKFVHHIIMVIYNQSRFRFLWEARLEQEYLLFPHTHNFWLRVFDQTGNIPKYRTISSDTLKPRDRNDYF